MYPEPSLTLMLVAGERSGDVYGGRLAAALNCRTPSLSLYGCGGDAMREGGVETVVDIREFAMVGITEVASGLPRAFRAFRRLLEQGRRRRPDLVILIDSPSLNLRLAKRLKRLGIPVLYFVSPQIWAWKKWRLRQLKGRVDKMACIFDFEEPLYRKAGIPAEYVGHPLADSVRPRQSREAFFTAVGLDPTAPTVALLPGSREIEIRFLLPVIGKAAAILAARRRIQFVVAVAPTLSPGPIQSWLHSNSPIQAPIRVLSNSTYDTLAHSDLAVVASGTATVEALLLDSPMVVVYRVSPLTALFARWMVDVPFYCMVNILAGKGVVPELIQSELTAPRLAAEVERILDRREVQLKMREEYEKVKARLGKGGAIERVADIALAMIERPSG